MATDVPYLAQTDALCGGAAAAMVFRYWGDVHADPQEFAPIVDRRAGGIANGALVDAVRRRGWQAEELAGGSADLQARLAARQPVVVLIADRGPRYHYVVAVGKTADAVVIHDPAWGPSRAIKDVDFDRIWRASGNWGLVILPPPAASFPDLPSAPSARVGITTLKGSQPESRCDNLLAAALDDIRASGDAAFDRADDVLDRVRQACPQSAGPLRELAGVASHNGGGRTPPHFPGPRWSGSRPMPMRSTCSARACSCRTTRWARFGHGIGSTGRASTWFGLPAFVTRVTRQSSRRLGFSRTCCSRRTCSSTRGAVSRRCPIDRRCASRSGPKPTALLRSTSSWSSEAVYLEPRPIGPPSARAHWPRNRSRSRCLAAPDRASCGRLNGDSGKTARASAWHSRRLAWAGFRGCGALMFWERESFSPAGTATVATIQESRLHGGLTVSNWLTPRLRYSISGGFDTWNGNRKTAVVGGAIERRWFGDRASIDVHAHDWIAVGGSRGFQSVGWRLHVRSSPEPRGWVALATAGADRVSSAAPLGLWPGAGDGQTRAPLLRATR